MFSLLQDTECEPGFTCEVEHGKPLCVCKYKYMPFCDSFLIVTSLQLQKGFDFLLNHCIELQMTVMERAVADKLSTMQLVQETQNLSSHCLFQSRCKSFMILFLANFISAPCMKKILLLKYVLPSS